MVLSNCSHAWSEAGLCGIPFRQPRFSIAGIGSSGHEFPVPMTAAFCLCMVSLHDKKILWNYSHKESVIVLERMGWLCTCMDTENLIWILTFQSKKLKAQLMLSCLSMIIQNLTSICYYQRNLQKLTLVHTHAHTPIYVLNKMEVL